MKFTFRGVRGSIPSPGPLTARYGGNTTCIEVRSDDDDLIILDAGSGIFSLAQQLPAGQRVDAHIFITHSHWTTSTACPCLRHYSWPATGCACMARSTP